MKRKIFIFSVVFLSFFMLYGRRWKGKTYVKEGVKIIENYESGFFINKKIEFKETLSIGKEDGKDYEVLNGQYLDIAVSSQGDIYIFDGKLYRLLKFDKTGKFLWQIGRKGEGPGEFKSGYCSVFITPSDKILIMDGLFLKYFDKNGKFKSVIKLNKRPTNLNFLKDGRMLICMFLFGQPGILADFYSKDGKFISKLPVEYRYGPKLSKTIGVSVGGGGFRVFGGKIYLSLPDKYEIREYDLKGKLKRVIKRDIKINPMNIKVMNKGGAVAVFPSDVSGPVFIYKNRYLINMMTKVKEISKDKYDTKKYLDFYNSEGKYIGSYKLPESTRMIDIDKNGNFYFIQYDPVPRVFRAKLLIE
jgi:hypothetical protein